MTVIKIEPFSVKSIGGIDVTITGIDPTDPHGVLSGTYNSVSGIELGRTISQEAQFFHQCFVHQSSSHL